MRDSVATLGEQLAVELRRVSERLRHLAAAGRPEREQFDAGRRLAQQLAELTAGIAGEPVRPVPLLADAVVGDQVAVIGADLLAALAERPDPAAAELAVEFTRQVRRLG